MQGNSRIRYESPSAIALVRAFGYYNWATFSSSADLNRVVTDYFQATAMHDNLLSNKNLNHIDEMILRDSLRDRAKHAADTVTYERAVASVRRETQREFAEKADIVGAALAKEESDLLHIRVEQMLEQPH